MPVIRTEVVRAALNRSIKSIDYKTYNDMHKRTEFRKQKVLADNSLTKDEKAEAIKKLDITYDRYKLLHKEGKKRTCENCKRKCLATLYCEYCVRNYLKAKFSNWTSGNNDLDNLIRKCQLETIDPEGIIEWIPYNNLQNVEYLTKGGISKIYTAEWIGGRYKIWNFKEQRLKRSTKTVKVILKTLENVENATKTCFEEAKIHLFISNKYAEFVQCYGLTQDPSNKNYMLVMYKMDIDLREYLQQNHNQLTWKLRIFIIHKIISALRRIHDENIIHRDLHSGNILYSNLNQTWYISDLGFCGPCGPVDKPDKPPKYIYGNLPYVAPEVIAEKLTTKASDIYSIAILMWEISSGEPPFIDHEHNNDLAMNIINGIRPRIVSGTPLEYKNLMEQCWDADPLKRPNIKKLQSKIREIYFSYQNMSNESFQPDTINNLEIRKTSYANSNSKVHQFEKFSDPKNATKEEQKEFHSKLHDVYIPDNIDNFNKKDSSILSNSIFRKLFKIFKKNSKYDIQNDFVKEEIMQSQSSRCYNNINDENEIYNNPKFYLEDLDLEKQYEFEIPDDI